MRRKLVAGNWKMHGRLASNASLVAELLQGTSDMTAVDIILAPVSVHIPQLQGLLAGSALRLAAQNAATEAEGAFTGEVAPGMLKELGVQAVILGHSERRSLYGESDALVVAKVVQALRAGLQPILCVGETLAEREAGETLAVVARQLCAVLDVVGVEAFAAAVLAYEPVWAIGTGKTASPEQAQEVHSALRAVLAGYDAVLASKLQILYGGSVKAANAASLFVMPDIDGALVGGASLQAQEFLAICRAAAQAD